MCEIGWFQIDLEYRFGFAVEISFVKKMRKTYVYPWRAFSPKKSPLCNARTNLASTSSGPFIVTFTCTKFQNLKPLLCTIKFLKETFAISILISKLMTKLTLIMTYPSSWNNKEGIASSSLSDNMFAVLVIRLKKVHVY